MTAGSRPAAARTTGSSRWALAALVAANLLPLVGVAGLGWRLSDVMVLYWLENGVIGGFTLLRILTSGHADSVLGALAGTAGKLLTMAFFTVHYGMFWTVHGIFVLELFTDGRGPPGGFPNPLTLLAAVDATGGFGWAVLGLVVSHGASFGTNWIGQGEFRDRDPREVMAQPYGRVVVLHLVIIFGGFLVMAIGQPLAALLLLVALKLGVDLAAHRREHRAAPRPDPEPASGRTAA